jgi:hypothetical protein
MEDTGKVSFNMYKKSKPACSIIADEVCIKNNSIIIKEKPRSFQLYFLWEIEAKYIVIKYN